MFNKLYRLFNYLKLKTQKQLGGNAQNNIVEIPTSVDKVKEILLNEFQDSSDFVYREITLGQNPGIKVLVAYIDGLIDKKMVSSQVFEPMAVEARIAGLEENLNQSNILKCLKNKILSISEIKEINNFEKSIYSILSGDTVIYIDGINIALRLGTRQWDSREVTEPETESVVRGPREGFTETLRTNTSLIRRKIKSTRLKMEVMVLGKESNTEVCLCYVKGLANEDIVKTARRRLKRIEIDAVFESGYIEEFIEDAPYSLFPTVGNSEKPDVVAGRLMEGRVAILCDGTPFALTVPRLFIENIQSSEDYYARPLFATTARILRTLAFIMTITLPAIYVALVNFHQDVIPMKLLLTIAASREGIPFSAFMEALLMGITFEMLREAGVRMPRPIGQAVSIVGALVLGEAAVRAGIASNPVIMVTAITAISSFMIPSLRGALPIIRIILLIAANILGLMGIFLVVIAFIVHLCRLRSFGVSYLAPFSPLSGDDLKDTFIRLPIWAMWKRPRSVIKDREERYRMKVDIRTRED